MNMKFLSTLHASWAIFLIIGSTRAFSGEAHSKDAVIALQDLPKSICDVVAAAFPGTTQISAGTRSKNGQITYYNVELQPAKEKGHFDVYLDATGTILSTAITITPKRLPDLIREKLAKSFKGWTFDEAERLVDYKTKKVTYSVELLKGTKTVEIDFEPSGDIISQEDLSDN